MSEFKTSRRNLLTGAGALAVSSPLPAAPKPIEWDETADVVIVGSGGAGVSAALAARECIAERIVILEKMSVAGGNTRFSCGYFNAVDPQRQNKAGIRDSLEKHIAHTMLSGRGRAQPELVRVLCSRALDTLHWLEGYGVQYEENCTQIYGGLFPRSHLPHLPEGLDSYIDILLKACAEHQIEVQCDSPMHELIVEKGRVRGVGYRAVDGSVRRIRANRAVVLAAGGFAANADLCRVHDPRLGSLETTNPSGSTGEVMLEAKRIGAYLVGCDYIECIPLHVHYARFAIMVERCIFVDHYGKRFIREDDRRDILRDRILRLPQRYGHVIVDNAGFLSCPFHFQKQLREGLKRQEVYSAQSPEELAQLLRLPSDSLVQTLERYNRFVRIKHDSDFGRAPESLLFEIKEAPFWACRASMSRHHTMGGVAIDEMARVLDWDRRPIPGLFAAGEVTGGIHGASRLGGNAISDVHVFGRIAGCNAAAEERS